MAKRVPKTCLRGIDHDCCYFDDDRWVSQISSWQLLENLRVLLMMSSVFLD